MSSRSKEDIIWKQIELKQHKTDETEGKISNLGENV
jgi:hypothetical protein